MTRNRRQDPAGPPERCALLLWIVAVVTLALAAGACGGKSSGDGDAGLNQNDDGDSGMAQCGNGEVDGLEECDDGQDNSDTQPDRCRTDCTAARCGDGVVDSQEECDDGPANADDVPNTCRRTCVTPGCGDEVVDTMFGEHCDDGNSRSRDGCSSGCKIEVPEWSEWQATELAARRTHVMAYDSARGRAVIFGGRGGGYFGDTWEYDGFDWIQISPVGLPPGRLYSGMVYFHLLGEVLMYGGSSGPFLGDTWMYDYSGPYTYEICGGGGDEDSDGLVDCDDPDCNREPVCAPLESCQSGGDEDSDLLIDCADPNCGGSTCDATGNICFAGSCP